MKDITLQQRMDKAYQAEHVQDYLDQHAGGGPISDIEIDEETYDLIGKMAEYYGMTRRQVLDRAVNNYIKRQNNEEV